MCDTFRSLTTGPAPSLTPSNGFPRRSPQRGTPPARHRTHPPTSLWSPWKDVPHLLSWTGKSHSMTLSLVRAWHRALLMCCSGTAEPCIKLQPVGPRSGAASPSRVLLSLWHTCRKCHVMGKDHLCPGCGHPICHP